MHTRPPFQASWLVLAFALAACGGGDHEDLKDPNPSAGGSGGADAGADAGPCETSADCTSSSRPVCNPATGTCVPCLTQSDCDEGYTCDDLACVEIPSCTSSLDCPLGLVCDTQTAQCVECLSDDDCAGDRCVGQVCRTACDSDNDCTPQGQLCDKDAGVCVDCFDHDQCETYEYCANGTCKPDVCEAGATSCEGNAVVACDDAGSGYESPVACNAGQSCAVKSGVAACQDWSCQPNLVFCTDDEEAVRCAADGLSQDVLEDCGASGEVCVGGACAEVICAPGEPFCSGNAVHLCSEKGDSSSVYTSCTAAQYCDDATATCLAKVCTPNEPACSGNVATTCNAQGSGYESGGIDCSTSGMLCSAGQCKSQVCEPNTDFCDAGAVRHCAGDGLSSTLVQTCSASQYCDNATATCKEQICVPGAAVCNGDIATTCNAEGSAYVSGGVDCTTTGEICHAGACTTLVCTPLSYFCEGGDVRWCGFDGLSSSLYDDCTSAEYCDDATAMCTTMLCSPGQPVCDGNTATTCNAQGSGYLSGGVACGMQHCMGGACVDQLFVEDFEDGDYVGWMSMGTDHTASVSSSVAADGTTRSLYVSKAAGSLESHEQGYAYTLADLQPQHISWWARASQTTLSSTYFVLQADSSGFDRIFSFYFRYTGYARNYVDSYTSYEVPYVANQWYHFELRNIDWATRTYDYYVDDALIQAGASLSGTGTSIARIDLYHFDGGTSGYWDEIVFE